MNKKRYKTDNTNKVQFRAEKNVLRFIKSHQALNDGEPVSTVMNHLLTVLIESKTFIPTIKDYKIIPFSSFDEIYPNRNQAYKAEQYWYYLKPSFHTFELIKKDIEKRRLTTQTKYFPNMFNYLLNKQWLENYNHNKEEEQTFHEKHFNTDWF